MVENKDGAERLLQWSYEAPTVEATAPSEEDVIAVAPTQVVVLEPSAPTEDELLASQIAQDTGHRQDTSSRSAMHSGSDRLAEDAAAEAREQGVELIRNHLGEYLVQNPDADYVTWIATLHPENAEVTIDPRFLIPGNPWATVFEEARAAAWRGAEPDHSSQSNGSSIDEAEEAKMEDPQFARQTTARNIHLGGLIPMIVGCSFLLAAMGVAFGLQLASTIVYMLAVFFKCICKCLPPFSAWTAVLYLIPGGLLIVFQSLDLLLLVLDTVLVELLGLLAYILCTLLSFSHAVGKFYHQQIRRLPHFMRWACRKHLQCDPPRASFPRYEGSMRALAGDGHITSNRGFRRVPTLDDDSSAGGIP